jgi:anti-anti-sigma factor
MPDETATILERRTNLIVLHVQPERLDETSLKALRAETAAAGSSSPDLPVVLDMGKVAFLASLSLGGLVQLTQAFRARKQRLILSNLQPAVRETIAITRLDRLFEIVDDLSALVV